MSHPQEDTKDWELPADVGKRLALEADAADLGDAIRDALPPGTGFALFVFDFGEGGNLAYVSNAQRPDMLRAIEEWKAKTS